MLQHVALQHTTLHCDTLHHIHHITPHRTTPHHTAPHCTTRRLLVKWVPEKPRSLLANSTLLVGLFSKQILVFFQNGFCTLRSSQGNCVCVCVCVYSKQCGVYSKQCGTFCNWAHRSLPFILRLSWFLSFTTLLLYYGTFCEWAHQSWPSILHVRLPRAFLAPAANL